MQLAFESPAVIVPLDVAPTGLVPPLEPVGLGEGDGLLDGDGLPPDDGLPVGEGLLLDDGLPAGDGLLLGDGTLPGAPPPASDAPRPSRPAALLVPGSPACLHGPLGEPGFLVISHETGAR